MVIYKPADIQYMKCFLSPLLISFMLISAHIPLIASTWEETGLASWYGGIFQGRLTASGEPYDTYGYTCAHKTLPFGTILDVKNLKNQKVVRVRVNDRGPFVEDRIIDLTYSAARELDMIRDGTARVLVTTTEAGFPVIRYNVQIGAWGNLDNARRHRQHLEEAGLKPKAVLNSKGITRLLMENIEEDDLEVLSARLKSLGYNNLLVSRVRQ